MGIRIINNVINQLGAPSIYESALASFPVAGNTGRILISTDTFALYRDNGITFDLIGGPGTGTITGTGTAGKITKFTSGSVIGDSIITESGIVIAISGNVDLGAGINSPYVRITSSSSTDSKLIFNGAGAGVDYTRIVANSGGTNNSNISFFTENILAVTILKTQSVTIANQLTVTGLSAGLAGNFVVNNGSGLLVTRTSAQVLSDIGAAPSGTYITSVSGTSPIVSSGGTSPAISIPVATTSVNGYLSSTDWNTFNGKESALTFSTGLSRSVNTITNTGVLSNVAGTDITVSGATGNVTIGNNSTLSSVTDRGSTTGMAITITNANPSTSPNSGALVVAGGFGLGGSIHAVGGVFSAGITFGTTSTIGTAISAQNVQFNINGVVSKSQRISFQNSNVDQWLLGAGAASETSAFELYNTTGIISVSINKSTNAATFSSSVTATQGTFNGGTASISTTTGSVIVTGGVGISGAVYTNGTINVNGAANNSLFSLNNNGTFYTVGFSPNATSFSTAQTISAGTTYIFNGGAGITFTMGNPSGNNQLYFVKNWSSNTLTILGFGGGTNIIDTTNVAVASLLLLTGKTVALQQDGSSRTFILSIY